MQRQITKEIGISLSVDVATTKTLNNLVNNTGKKFQTRKKSVSYIDSD